MAKSIVTVAVKSAFIGKVSADSIFRVVPSALNIEAGYNVRTFSPDTNPLHAELLASIGVIGVRTPLVIRMEDGKPVIVQGHMRHAAALMHNAIDGLPDNAKIASIPCRLANEADTAADRALDLLTSNSGIPLAQIERGHAVLRLRSLGWTDADIGTKAGLTSRTLQEAVKLAKADKAIVLLVKGYVTAVKDRAGKAVVVQVSDTLATQTMTAAGPDAAAVLQEAAKLAAGSSKAGKVVAGHVEAAIVIVAKGKGSPVLTGQGVPSAKGKNVKGVALAIDAAAVTAQLAKGKPAIVSGQPVHLKGPFTCKADGSIVDDIGELLATAATLDIGNEVCRYLNSAYATFAVERMAIVGLASAKNATGPLQGVKGATATAIVTPAKAGKSGSSEHATR